MHRGHVPQYVGFSIFKYVVRHKIQIFILITKRIVVAKKQDEQRAQFKINHPLALVLVHSRVHMSGLNLVLLVRPQVP